MTTTESLACLALLLALLIADLVKRGWKLSWSRRAIAGVAATIAIFHINLLFVPIVWVAAEQVKSAYAHLGIPSVPEQFWSGYSVWLLAPLTVVIYDFVDYWTHRLMHMKWLWPIHAIHHSDPDVTGLTNYRVHFLEGLIMWSSYTVCLTWLGLPSISIGIGAVFFVLHGIYVHADLDWEHGPFKLLLASPRFHRWHHADVPEAYGTNLANVCPIFDWMFGTYRVPGVCHEPLGAEGVPHNDVVRLMVWPFVEWLRMLVDKLRPVNSLLRQSDNTAIPKLDNRGAEG